MTFKLFIQRVFKEPIDYCVKDFKFQQISLESKGTNLNLIFTDGI